ncbi:MAG: GMC family oxidoreductase N-terminal domain-containing protein, partial [bacterium]
PLLAFVANGLVLLFLGAFYLNSGIRENDQSAIILAGFTLISGTSMMLFLLAGNAASPHVTPVVIVGFSNYAIGGLTSGFLWAARRSRSERGIDNLGAISALANTSQRREITIFRLSLISSAVIFGIVSLAVLAGGLFFLSYQPARSAYTYFATGNAVAFYAALAYVCTLAAKTPQKRSYSYDLLLLSSITAAIVLFAWPMRFAVAPATRTAFFALSGLHAVIVIVVFFLGRNMARAARAKLFFGPRLHRIFEGFSEVIIKGNSETITAREITDIANNLLHEIPSRRIISLKAALLFIEFGSLIQFRAPMTRLGKLEREHYLTRVFKEGRGIFRDLIKIKQLVYLVYYSDARTYKKIGFVDFKKRDSYREAKEKNQIPAGEIIYPTAVTENELHTDVCVIGSGAGGAVVAARLAEAGKRVVILEEGPFLKRDLIELDERSMQVKTYRDGGLQLSLDYDMYVLQGRCVGGSTVINNCVCFDPPKEALEKFDRLGANLDHAKFAASLKKVRAELNIIDLEAHPHLVFKGSLKFREGCQRLGLDTGYFEVNASGCIGCGYCTTGCAFDKKTSVDLSYIPRALAAGAIVASECKATKITTRSGKAQAVECVRPDGTRLKVRAKQIVVACGAIASSLLLQNSGIKRNVGTRLSFNVGSWVCAEFPEPLDSFDGFQMCTYHERPGFFLETIAMNPGAFAVAMPGWFDDHFDQMRRYRYFTMAGALVGTQPTGRVKAFPLPVLKDILSPIDFRLPIPDLMKLRNGVKEICRIFLSAGATRVIPATFRQAEFLHTEQIDHLDELVLEPDDISFGSAHPQGGNPMSDDKKLGAIDSQFRVHGFDNLYVCDASVFPVSIAVNPQLTIMAMADYASEIIGGA